jgi:hypothetical protein
MFRSLAAIGVLVLASAWVPYAQQPTPPAADQPTPRLADGTINLGRVKGEKGVWRVPYITNMAMRVVGADGKPLPQIAGVPPAPGGGRRGSLSSRGRPRSTTTTRATTPSSTPRGTACRPAGRA